MIIRIVDMRKLIIMNRLLKIRFGVVAGVGVEVVGGVIFVVVGFGVVVEVGVVVRVGVEVIGGVIFVVVGVVEVGVVVGVIRIVIGVFVGIRSINLIAGWRGMDDTGFNLVSDLASWRSHPHNLQFVLRKRGSVCGRICGSCVGWVSGGCAIGCSGWVCGSFGGWSVSDVFSVCSNWGGCVVRSGCCVDGGKRFCGGNVIFVVKGVCGCDVRRVFSRVRSNF